MSQPAVAITARSSLRETLSSMWPGCFPSATEEEVKEEEEEEGRERPGG